MLKFLDKIWCWHGWTIVKWPFGAAILVFVLMQIYYLETVKGYDRKFQEAPVKVFKEFRVPQLQLPRSEMVKNTHPDPN